MIPLEFLTNHLRQYEVTPGELEAIAAVLDSKSLAEIAFNLGIKTNAVRKRLGKEFVLSKQLLRSGTSIGANIAEAKGGISKADFSAKISIAYKETLETFGFAESPFRRNVGTQRAFTGFLY